MATKRLRIFAGPNGSGKSSIYKTLVSQGEINLGFFVNADEIERQLKDSGKLDLSNYGVSLDLSDLKKYCSSSSYSDKNDVGKIVNSLTSEYNSIIVADRHLVNSYFAALIADYLRINMLDNVDVFTIETVMSHESKLKYIELAKQKGYRVYLYFVSTEDVMINISRVSSRVDSGGHPVPEDKIKKRYNKSLDLLYDALKLVDRAYIFDNSLKDKPILFSEYDGHDITILEDAVPMWIDKYLLKKLN